MTSGSDPNRPSILGGPAVILVEPQLGENIGAVARAMLNCGLTELRLVRPRDGWPNPRATAAAAGADEVLDNAKLYPDARSAVSDLRRVFATTGRPRDLIQSIVTPRAAAAEMRRLWREEIATGVMFGPERTGLINDDLSFADTLITAPLNPAFASLNLAQAVLIIGYEWFQTGDALPSPTTLHTGQTRPATKIELVNLFEHLEEALDAGRFFTSADKRPSMTRTLRNALQRMQMTEQEVRTFHGAIVSLCGRRKSSRP